MFRKLIAKVVGDPNKKIIKELQPIVTEVASYEPALQALSDEDLRLRTGLFRERLERGETVDDILPEAFALVREASHRSTGLRHYDVQIMGGILLHRGEVVEMRTGEGKTLVATLPLYVNALLGRGIHLVTVNDYLARRDGGWMGKIFNALGLTVGCIGPQRFSAYYDPEYVNPGADLEDDRLVHWRPCTRTEAYRSDITYGTSSEFGFDYLRDNMVRNGRDLVQGELHMAVIDEVDNVLIDEARTPLIISGPADRTGKDYVRFAQYVRNLKRNTVEDEDEEPNGHYDLDEKSRSVTLTDIGIQEIENRIPEINVDAGDSLYDPRFFSLTYYLDNALKAEYLYRRDQQYVVQDAQEVLIVDDFTGRLMPGRRYSDGLHEAIEAKEGVTVKRETTTVATITLQNYFRLYEKLAGMTGTAMTDGEEFDEIYGLGVSPLPTNVQYIVDSGTLTERRRKKDNAEEVYYTRENDPDSPIFFKRLDYPDQVYSSEEAKDKAIVNEIHRVADSGRPVLVGTTSVEHSEKIAKMLKRKGVRHNVLNAKIHQSEAMIVAQAGRPGAVTISTNMAGRGTDILLGGNAEGLAAEALEKQLFDRRTLADLALTLLTEGEAAARTNAKKSGRMSVDLVDGLIKVKAEFDDALIEIEGIQAIGFVARSLQKPYEVDYSDALNVTRLVQAGRLSEARDYAAGQEIDAALVEDAARWLDLYSRYQFSVKDDRRAAQFLADYLFDQHYNGRAAIIRAVLQGEEKEARQLAERVPGLQVEHVERIRNILADTKSERHKIWESGGLHVVGSERHESRRIDNQLRGRAGRQGDPGSSRFFLSLEDELMRRFGGERLKRFMNSNVIPDDMPLEMGLIDRIIGSAQERIEGYNFDIRKNVVEYDDVMAKQREAIYRERRAILRDEQGDQEKRIEEAFARSIGDLAQNYLVDYIGFMRREIERVVQEFSTDATDEINVLGVVRRLRGYLPSALRLEMAEIENLAAEPLVERLLELAYENQDDGTNLYQLLRNTGRFIPLLPPIPNLSGQLAARRSGLLQAKDNIRLAFVDRLQTIYDDFLAEQVEEQKRQEIWDKALQRTNAAFERFSVERRSRSGIQAQQEPFREEVAGALNDLLLDSLSALESDQLVAALVSYVAKQRALWAERIGAEEYQNFQRLLLLNGIDREWRDYLTAMDDLRREIGLEAVAQRDPKVEYKRRSYQMFADMRSKIDEIVVDRYFIDIARHQAFIEQQEASVAYQEQLSQAGYQVIKRKTGKGYELRRDVPKVGRNDPCPCGSGKKYKQCHMRQDKVASRRGQGARSKAK